MRAVAGARIPQSVSDDGPDLEACAAFETADAPAQPNRSEGPDPADERRRSIRYFRRLLHLRRDDAIAAAIDAMPTDAAARGLLRLAQEVSECVGDEWPTGPHARLYCVPLLFEFPEPLPATQLDAALLRVVRRGACDLFAPDRGAATDDVDFVPEFLEIGDLANLQFSTVLHGAIALHSGRHLALPSPHPFARGNHPQRRSQSFLRYLVGLRPMPSSGLQPGNRKRIAVAIQKEVAGLAGTVRACRDGHFHDAVYVGMWAHQARRLAQAAQARAQHAVDGAATAALYVDGTPLRPHIRIGFGQSGMRPSTDYLLRCRPLEDRDRACRRVARIIELAGLRVTAGAGSPGAVLLRL